MVKLQSAAVIYLDAACADQFPQCQECSDIGAAALLVAEQLPHLLQTALEQPAQHMGDPARHRDKRRCDQRFELFLRALFLAGAAAH